MFGVFRVKNQDFMPKNYIFSNFRGGGGGVRSPGAPLDIATGTDNDLLNTVQKTKERITRTH